MNYEKGRLSSRQLVVLIMFVMIGDMALVYPITMVSGTHQDAWISSLVSMPLGLATVALMLKVHSLYPGLSLIESCLQILGKWLGTAVCLFYLFYFLMASSVYIREIEDFLATQIYERTPGEVFRIMFLILLVYGIRLGLETLGRAAEVLLPLFILFLASLLLMLLPQIRLGNLFPIMNAPIPSMLHSVLYGVFYPFGELIAIMMILPYSNIQRNTKKSIFIGLIIGSTALNLLLFLSITVLGPYLSEHHFYATYVLAQKISVGEFLQRFEALLATVWVITTYFKSTIYFYAFTHGTAQLLRVKNFYTLVLPTGFLLFGLSQLIAQDITFYIHKIPAYWVDWNVTQAFIIPLLLLIVYSIRRSASSAD